MERTSRAMVQRPMVVAEVEVLTETPTLPNSSLVQGEVEEARTPLQVLPEEVVEEVVVSSTLLVTP